MIEKQIQKPDQIFGFDFKVPQKEKLLDPTLTITTPPRIPPDFPFGGGGGKPFGDMGFGGSGFFGDEPKSRRKFFRVWDIPDEPFGAVKVGVGYYEDKPYSFDELSIREPASGFF